MHSSLPSLATRLKAPEPKYGLSPLQGIESFSLEGDYTGIHNYFVHDAHRMRHTDREVARGRLTWLVRTYQAIVTYVIGPKPRTTLLPHLLPPLFHAVMIVRILVASTEPALS